MDGNTKQVTRTKKKPASPATRVDAIVLPSSEQIREEAKAILDATGMIDLAKALSDGERIQSYEPFTKWLAAGRHGDLYLRQMAESILWELHERNATGDLREIQRQALEYLLKK